MPDLWMDVDAAVIVPVNIMPLLDDTDFKTIEVAVVYNSAGMDLVWNFVPCAGPAAATAVTPTTAGVYDWVEHIANKGMYSIEIPASGGGTINNNTEGVGWFTGVATGVLPWRGPTIGFRRAALNDLFIEGSTASTNLEDFFDGTGYAGGTAKLTVDLTKILGTAPTEGAGGRVAAAFTKFFDKATPTGTINSLPDAVAGAAGGVAIVGSQMVVPNTQKVDVETIKTQAVTCGAGVTVLASVGTAATSTAQTGDSYPKVDTEVGTLVTGVADIQSRLPAALTGNGNIKASVLEFITTALTETVPGYITAAFKKLFDVVTPLLVASDVMRGTDSAALASVCTEGRLSELDAGTAGKMANVADVIAVDVAGLDGAAMRGTDNAALASELDKVPKSDAAVSWNATALAAIQSEANDALVATQTEGYAADAATASLVQLAYMIWARLAESSVVGTTLTAKKLDGATSAMTFTLNDGTTPTSITRAS